MGLPRQSAASYQDLEQVPDNLLGELINGELIINPRPAPKHALAASALGSELGNPFQRGRGGPGGWWIIDEPELRLAGDAYVPDLAGWRKERLLTMPDTAFFDVAPDWVCEILSPSTVRIDRVLKMPAYAMHRVGHLWLIDPLAQTLEVFQLQGTHWLLKESFAQAQIVRAVPFAEFELELAALWGK
jgi:Uma2 family endonuclease